MAIQQITQDLNKTMRLRQMNTACVGLLPNKTHSIESNPTNPVTQHSMQKLDETEKNLRVVPIQIDLIRTKCGPNLTTTIGPTELGK